MIRKKVLTTGEVAKICSVAPRTVSKWFDSGQLKGYRIPGSRDRRIPVSELIRFMKAYDMPLLEHFAGTIRVLIADGSDGANKMAEQIESKRDYEVEVAGSDFEVGTAIQKLIPHVILINVRDKNIDSEEICKEIRENEDLQTVKILAISDNAKEAKSKSLLEKGFDGIISDSGNVDEIIKKIDRVLTIVY